MFINNIHLNNNSKENCYLYTHLKNDFSFNMNVLHTFRKGEQ